MTFAMMWTHKNTVLAAADTVIMEAGDAVSGTTALGQRDRFEGYIVHEGAMKLAIGGGPVLMTGAGSGEALERAFAFIDRATRTGRPLAQVLDSVAKGLAGRGAELLVGTMNAGVASVSHLAGGAVHDVTGRPRVVGSLPKVIGDALAESAAETPLRASARDSLTGLQIAAQQAIAKEPGVFRGGVGGAVLGAALGTDGVESQHDTLWVYTDDEFFRAFAPLTEASLVGPGVVFSSTVANIGYVFSSLYDTAPAEAVFASALSGLSNTDLERWSDSRRERVFSPDIVVFSNLRLDLCLVVPHASHPSCPLRILRKPFGFALEPERAAMLSRLFGRQPHAGLALLWYEWWVPGE